jgi:hypothetical protein
MTTNVYLAFPFGAVSVAMHFIMLIFDRRRSYKFYNLSLFAWVIGNFMWMLIELTSIKPSTNIHFGPTVPIGGLNNNSVESLTVIKTFLFIFGAIVQLIMYIFVYCKFIAMPENDDEDAVSRNEAMMLCYGKKINYAKTLDIDFVIDLNDDFSMMQNSITLVFIEHSYIIFWILKDLFWSWGTGDLTEGRDLAIFYESFAMVCGTISILIYITTAYLYRRNISRFLDSITTIIWITANYVWMCGEFFTRYDNLELDDANEGDDSTTRILSSILFSFGIALQVLVICVYCYQFFYKKDFLLKSHEKIKQIEMFEHMKSATTVYSNRSTKNSKKNSKYNNIVISIFTPQFQKNKKIKNKINKNDSLDEEDDDVFF